MGMAMVIINTEVRSDVVPLWWDDVTVNRKRRYHLCGLDAYWLVMNGALATTIPSIFKGMNVNTYLA